MSNTNSSFPTGIDTNLKIPRTPSVARLSEAESPEDYGYAGHNENSHSDLHYAENNSIQAIERSVIPDYSSTSHDHSDPYNVDYSLSSYRSNPSLKKGRKLRVQNTHVFADNSSPTATQAAAPDSSASSIHHSVGIVDAIGDYQAVSGKLWKDKGLNDVPSAYFDAINTMQSLWKTDAISWPGDKLLSQLKAIVDYSVSVKSELDDLQAFKTAAEARFENFDNVILPGLKSDIAALKAKDTDLQNQITALSTRTGLSLSGIIGKIWGNPSINSDGSINWNTASSGKIPIADLNVFSGGSPSNSTTSNAIRSRNLGNADVRVQ